MQVVRNGIAQRRRGVTIDRRRVFQSDPYASYPNVSSSRLWLNRQYGLYTDTAGTTPAAVNDSIASWRAVGGAWGTDLLTQPTAAARPVIKSDGIQCDGVDDKLLLPSSIALSGDWTMYMVATQPSIASLQWANDSGSNILGNFGGNQFYYFTYSSGPFADTTTGTNIKRYRKSSTTGYFKKPGLAELSHTITGDLVWDRIFGRSGESSTSTDRILQMVFVQKAVTHGDADDLAIRAKLLALEPTAADL